MQWGGGLGVHTAVGLASWIAADMEESIDRIVAGEGDRQLAELSGRMGLPAVWH